MDEINSAYFQLRPKVQLGFGVNWNCYYSWTHSHGKHKVS